MKSIAEYTFMRAMNIGGVKYILFEDSNIDVNELLREIEDSVGSYVFDFSGLKAEFPQNQNFLRAFNQALKPHQTLELVGTPEGLTLDKSQEGLPVDSKTSPSNEPNLNYQNIFCDTVRSHLEKSCNILFPNLDPPKAYDKSFVMDPSSTYVCKVASVIDDFKFEISLAMDSQGVEYLAEAMGIPQSDEMRRSIVAELLNCAYGRAKCDLNDELELNLPALIPEATDSFEEKISPQQKNDQYKFGNGVMKIQIRIDEEVLAEAA